MIVALDVAYRAEVVVTACVGFAGFSDATATLERVVRDKGPAASYEPGRFYLRELPYLLGALRKLAEPPAICVVDGYAWLGVERPGLGAHLSKALGGTPVVGVAKNAFARAPARAVLRGKSARPLYVTAEKMPLDHAVEAVRAMHGQHRMPTLLHRVDALAREKI